MKLKQMTACLLAVAITITGIYIPVIPEKAYATEVEITDTVDTSHTAGSIDTYTSVRSAKELISALNGQSVSAASVKIQVEDNFTEANDDTYKIVAGDVDLNTGIVLPENTDITVDMAGHDLTVSDNVVESSSSYLKLVVPKSSRLTITSNGGAAIPFEIENHGTLILAGTTVIFPTYGNGILNTGTVNVEEHASVKLLFGTIEDDEKKAPIHNAGGTVVINTDNSINTSQPSIKNRSAIINKDGNLIIEKGQIGNYSSAISGNAILNEGSKANLEIRGGQNTQYTIYSSTDCAIVNNGGKVNILEGTKRKGTTNDTTVYIQGKKIGILTYNGGSLTMYSGAVSGSGDSAAISTTPYIYRGPVSSVSSGSVKILGGQVGKEVSNTIGIAYAGSELPVLMGGKVYGVKGAVGKYTSAGTLEPVTTYQFRNKNNQIVDAYTPAEGAIPAKALTSIIDGLNTYASQTVSFDGIKVKTFEELQKAVVSGGSIQITEDMELTKDLVFEKDATLYACGKKLTINDPNVQVKINEKVNVRFASEQNTIFMQIKALSSNEAAIINHGTLSMNQILIYDTLSTFSKGKMIQNTGIINITDSIIVMNGGGLSKDEPSIILHNAEGGQANISGNTSVESRSANSYGMAIYNEGSLWMDTAGNGILTGKLGGIALFNAGTAEMTGKTEISSFSKNSIAVKNMGSFIMRGGKIAANYRNSAVNHSYAILFGGTNMPILIGGRVEGAYVGENFTPLNACDGSAVAHVTDWDTLTMQTGSFTNEDKSVTTSGKDSSLILNGIPRVYAAVTTQQDYLLMEKGEVITDCVSKLFDEQYEYTISNNFSMTSTSANVVSVSKNSAGEWTAKAEGTGMSMLRIELEEAGITDYIRVEVVEDREKLSSESFQGSVLGGNVLYNAYRSSLNVPLEWHLKDSYDITSGSGELDLGNLVKPTSIQLESQDPNFEKYFSYYSGLNYNSASKEYGFSIYALSKSPEEYNYLVSDEIKGISDIEAKLTIEINGKTETINLGTFDIVVDSTQPKFEYRQITLNSAYTAETCYDTLEYDGVCPNYAALAKYSDVKSCYITKMACPNGFSNKPLITNADEIEVLSYQGAPKTGAYSIPVTVCSPGFNGSFETKIPIKVINEKPKADVTNKKIVVAKTTADSSDIPMLISGKTEASVATVSKVEILEKNSSFVIANSVLDGENLPVVVAKGYVHNVQGNASFYLQQRKALTKAEKVTLKFTYQGARGSSKATQIGSTEPCDFTSTTTVTVVPKELAKASMKQTNKPVLVAKAKAKENKTIVYDYTALWFSTTPSNYDGGYFVASGLNGKEITGMDVGKVVKKSDGNYAVEVYANSNSKAGKKQFAIYWYDKDGKQIGKPLKASVIFQASSQLKLKTSKVEMDINRERTFNKSGYETTYDGVGAKIKYAATSDWYRIESLNPDFFIYAKSATAVTLKPREESLKTGTLLPGKTYSVDLKFYNTYGDSKIETIQVKIKDIKDIKVQVADTSIYKNAPYEQSILAIHTSKPACGLYVTKVEITDTNTPFETKAIQVTGYTYSNQNTYMGQEALWSIAFKENKYNSKLIGSQKVSLKLTYQNGSTATTQMNVYVVE